MKMDPPLNPQRTAVLCMDMQQGIVSIYTANQQDLIARAAKVLHAVRQRGMTVIHIRMGFRAGLPEVSPRNPLLNAIRNSPQHQQLFSGEAGEIHPVLGPAPSDIVITKHRVSAFTGTDLEMILRARDIDTLVLFGIATSGVVLSTLLAASDADYRIVVLRDCCTDMDNDLHRCLVDKLFPRRATVTDATDFLTTAWS